MGLDLDPENEKLREALQGVSDDLTGAQLKMVRGALRRLALDSRELN